MLLIDPRYLAAAHNVSTAADLQELLVNAIRLEHATIPPYLAAAYSLESAGNRTIRLAIEEIAIEEMAHMAIAANVLNAIDGRPEFDRPDFIPSYPTLLPMNVGDLVVGIKKFSKPLVGVEFMQIEEPETPLHFPDANAMPIEVEFATIGAFYRALMDKITQLGDEIFKGNPDRQIFEHSGFPPNKLFAVTNAETAVRALERIVKDGEGTTELPFDEDNELAHYYRFEEIFRGRTLSKDLAIPEGYSFGDPKILFDEAGVADFPDNPKAGDYAQGSLERTKIDEVNVLYSDLLRTLQVAFDGHPTQILDSLGVMRKFRLAARRLVSLTDPATGKRLGPTFEFVP